ncbi:transporter, partial [Bacteroides thetaiotaomicron]
MEWLYNLFLEHSALQAVVVLSLISAIGLGLGRVHFWGVSLGVTFVFFAGILAGHFGLSVDPQMLNYAESFGLVIFGYSLGLWGTLLTVVASYATGVSLPDMVGILCGATTNTPALGAAQQTLKQMGIESSTPALGCAVAYPMGVIGVILAVLLIRKFLVHKEDLEIKEKDDANKTFIAAFQVHNPAIFNKSIKDIAQMSYPKFVISRLWRDGHVSIPTSDKVLKEGDRLLVITAEKNVLALTVLFGEQEENTDWNKEDIDWNAIDSELISQRIVVTRPELNGKKLGSLRLRNHYGINISRVYRSGVQLLATPELILQLGDRLTVVGEAAAIQNVEKVLGNAVKSLKEPNLVVIFIGIVLGLALGAIPFSIPGISTPVKLGLAGGPIIVGILLGTFGPRI